MLLVLGGGAWSGWEFYVKPNLPGASADPLPPPVATRPRPSGSGADAPLPTAIPLPVREPSRAARLGPEERRLVDENVRGFFTTSGTGSDVDGLNLVLYFKRPVNVSGIGNARIVSAFDETGASIPLLVGARAELRRSASDDPTEALRVPLFARMDDPAAISRSLRTITVQIGPATIRARYSAGLL